MADTKLSALTELDAAPATTDELFINDGGTSKKITVENLVSFVLSQAREFSKVQNFNETTLTDAATIAWDAESNQVCKVTLGGNRTLGAATNQKAGAFYSLRCIQDGTGSRTLAFNANYHFAGGTAPTLTTAANAVDVLTFLSNGTNMILVGTALDVKAA